MTRWTAAVSWLACSLLVVACGETDTTPSPPEHEMEASTSGGPDTGSVVRSLEGTQENWFAAGAKGQGATIDSKGRPARPAGRYVNEGRGIVAGDLGGEGWLMGGRDGSLNLINASGNSIETSGPDEQRLVLKGRLQFISAGGNGWLIGGSRGGVQKIGPFGELQTGVETFPNSTVSLADASYLNGEWLVLSDDGRMSLIQDDDISSLGQRLIINGQPRTSGVTTVGDKWYVFTDNGYVTIQSGGNVTEPISLGDGFQITEVTSQGNTIALGNQSGEVALVTPSNLPNLSWNDALEGNRVNVLVSSARAEIEASYDEWLAVGPEGKARRLDRQGQPLGSVATVGRGEDLQAARPRDDGWAVGMKSFSAIQSLERDLTPEGRASDRFDGATIRATAAGGGQLLAVGDGGHYRVFNPDGSTATEIQTLESEARLTTVAWNGGQFLVGGQDGTLTRLDPEGEVVSTHQPLGDTAIAALSWSGKFWLVVGANGDIQRLRRDGSSFGDTGRIELTQINDISFEGSKIQNNSGSANERWIVAGAQDGDAALTAVSEHADNGTDSGDLPSDISNFDGPILAIGTTGNEWLIGGQQGQVARISTRLDVIARGEGIRTVLYGNAVRAIQHNGAEHYLIAGDRGAIQRLLFDARPESTPAAVNNFEDVRALAWTPPVGFPPGPCASGVCYNGSCIEGQETKFCCESACEGPCRSCLESENNEANGLCEPIPAGEYSPDRKEQTCQETDPASCGQTGVCDGDGGCEYWRNDDSGDPVQCQPPTCSNGEVTGAGTCASADNGMCQTPEPESCDPYKGCNDKGTGCKTSCRDPQDCITGYVCRDGTCQAESSMQADAGTETMADTGPNGGGNGSEGSADGGGGCSTTSAPLMPSFEAFALLLGLVALRRSREVGIQS